MQKTAALGDDKEIRARRFKSQLRLSRSNGKKCNFGNERFQ